jgi:DNA-binding MarR family transcriptional regulator
MPDSSTHSTQRDSADLVDLPPSAKLVAKTLEYEGESTQAALTESTLLPARTVRNALSELEAAGLVTSRISFMDARQRFYSLEMPAE